MKIKKRVSPECSTEMNPVFKGIHHQTGEKKKVTVFKSMRVLKCSFKEVQRRADYRNY